MRTVFKKKKKKTVPWYTEYNSAVLIDTKRSPQVTWQGCSTHRVGPQYSSVRLMEIRRGKLQYNYNYSLGSSVWFHRLYLFWRNIPAVSALACDCYITTTAWDERNPLKKECHWGCSPLCKDPPGVIDKFIVLHSRVFHTRVWVAQFARQRKEARSSVRKITLVCSEFCNCTTYSNILYYARGFLMKQIRIIALLNRQKKNYTFRSVGENMY